MKKLILWPLVVLIVCGAIFVINFIWFKPFSINHFYERVFLEYGLLDPEGMSQLGLLDGTPFDYYNDELTDASPRQFERSLALSRKNVELLRAYDRDVLSPQQQRSYDVLSWYLQNRLNQQPFKMHGYVITQNYGAYLGLVDFMTRVHRVADERGAKDYLSRLRAVAFKMDQELAVAQLQVEAGIVPPRFIITKILLNLHNIRDGNPGASLYFTMFKEKLASVNELTADVSEKLESQALVIIRDGVHPAYDRTIAFFTALEKTATDAAGIWKHPNGAAYYQYLIGSHTTTDLTAEEIHELGLAEVTRIEKEMAQIFLALGHGHAPVAESLRKLSTDPRFLSPDTDQAKDELVAQYQQILDEINEGVSAAFRIKPRAALKVKRIPAYRESTAASHYAPPTLDGSRLGIFFVNLSKIPPSWTMRTLAYHEGIPGHHFQIGIQSEMKDVPTFRKFVPFSAHVEGWALYAERLAWEMGCQSDPYDNLGRLQAELFRAARLVVDTGLHHKRWTREKALQYFSDHIGNENISEIERYVVWPGQALAYKIGMVKILSLRERARERLGNAFDIRDFHQVVIGNGAMPLSVLEQQVENYITETGAI
jgi:uncharacterized protein (DUF885 family)